MSLRMLVLAGATLLLGACVEAPPVEPADDTSAQAAAGRSIMVATPARAAPSAEAATPAQQPQAAPALKAPEQQTGGRG